ncbi:hypothetical protein [Enterococcus pallens]|uniref:Uncharacterized protein n=1 Tax=Enterococcus pallens ATCC BAA-351 TaxID=1158607 RepID=R2Q315_9ENTE|nr:hypothetical protein [Enterococcus pallens]EOH90942.1 hypothetical protein UAU_03481 [Enterococcus pallens ATCC BAA-351]EOU16138.1 hypothetical protein I588_03794 [Enterococcus pallens ATCC BAA-351]OJG77387.1 hypothetical protein RV10_GL002497 [Enterococcus pallens]
MRVNRWLISLASGSAFLYIFKTVYNSFGHGVTSEALDNAWWWPLTLFFFLLVIRIVKPAVIKTFYMRNSCRSYLLAVISVVCGQVLSGIFEIAGTSSSYVRVYDLAALIFILIGSVYLVTAIRVLSLKHSNI